MLLKGCADIECDRLYGFFYPVKEHLSIETLNTEQTRKICLSCFLSVEQTPSYVKATSGQRKRIKPHATSIHSAVPIQFSMLYLAIKLNYTASYYKAIKPSMCKSHNSHKTLLYQEKAASDSIPLQT